jgi:H+/Cl- antiporter ClcA
MVCCVAAIEGSSRDWLLSIQIPTVELRDALITEVAGGVSALTAAPVVGVRMIATVMDAGEPMLEMHIRTKAAIHSATAKAVAMETLHLYASSLDLSEVTVGVMRPLAPDEPSPW